MRTCPFCRSETTDDTTFCGQCGRRLFNLEETFTDSNVTRISGSYAPDGTGTTLGEKTADEQEFRPTTIVCLSCHADNPPHAIYCRNCGVLLKSGISTPTSDMSAPGWLFPGPIMSEGQAAAGHVPMVQGTPPVEHVPLVEGTPPVPAGTPASQAFGQGPPSAGQRFAPGQTPSSPASRPALVSGGQRPPHGYKRRTVLVGLAATVVALVVGSEVAISALFRKQPSTPSNPAGPPPTTTSITPHPTNPSNPSGVPPAPTSTTTRPRRLRGRPPQPPATTDYAASEDDHHRPPTTTATDHHHAAPTTTAPPATTAAPPPPLLRPPLPAPPAPLRPPLHHRTTTAAPTTTPPPDHHQHAPTTTSSTSTTPLQPPLSDCKSAPISPLLL